MDTTGNTYMAFSSTAALLFEVIALRDKKKRSDRAGGMYV